jgi:anthranilate phosphoribosyltransferase
MMDGIKMLEIVVNGEINFDDAKNLINELVLSDEIRAAAMLAALEARGYDAEVLAGFAEYLRENMVRIDAKAELDTCGTGGDGSSTINVSTAVSILLSSVMKVAKHGNRAVTSSSGSSDVLERLGIPVPPPEKAAGMLEAVNYVFLHAPLYHPVLSRIMPIRRKLGIKTIFNLLGPLCNPALPDRQIIGCRGEVVQMMGEAMQIVGIEGLVVGSSLDEVSPEGYTLVAEVERQREVEVYTISPSEFGVEEFRVSRVVCSSSEESAARIEAVFRGRKGYDREFILMNASAALYAAGRVSDFREGYQVAKNLIDNGIAVKKLEELRKYGGYGGYG